MEKMILVADDSLTIQKVIKITLSEHPFKLEESRTEADLFAKIKTHPYALILLDFGLSESHSGYELATEIKKIRPEAKIIALLGTFDSVDDSEIRKIGFSGSIVKPFESTKFIALCLSVLEGAESNVPNFSESDDGGLSGWDHKSSALSEDIPPVMEEDPGRLHLEKNIDAALSLEMEDWGLAIPPPIKESISFNLPGVIEEGEGEDIEATAPFDLDKIHEEELQSVPVENELEYPKEPSPLARPKSKLVPMTELAPDDLEELEFEGRDYIESDETDPAISTDGLKERTGVNLQAEILAEGDPDNFWAVDDGFDSSPKTTDKVADQGISAGSKAIATIKAQESTSQINIAPEAIAADLFEKVKPLLDKLISEYCKQKTEEVAWEVIPDLAENLIRQEIKSISASLE